MNPGSRPDYDPVSSAMSGAKKARIIILGIIFGSIILLYLFQLFSLQVLEGGNFQKRATLFSQRGVALPAPRGEIFDRNHNSPLASNRLSFDIEFVPGEAPKDKVPVLLSKLAVILHLPAEALEKKIPPTSYEQFKPIELRSGVDYNVMRTLAERVTDFPGIHWEQSSIREYHDLRSLASVLGYVGNITEDELQVLYNSGYSAKSVIGKSGLEKQYDFLLRGKDGTRFSTVDAMGRGLGSSREDPPKPGKTIVLTIDRTIQTLAEKSLGDRIGSVVVLKPSTGEILAMVSYPYFDPNQFYSDDASQSFEDLLTDTRYPFLNRTIQATYPPASTFKTIMCAAVIGAGVVDPDYRVFSGPAYKLGDRMFKEHDPRGFGWVNMARALAMSANIYFYTIGVEHLGIDRIDQYAKDFGLGQPTGVDLPGEVSGQVPGPDWKEKALHSPWVGGDTANTSIGQGYLQVTPLQMADAIALVSNEGKVYRPHLLKQVIDPETNTVEDEPPPEVLFESNVPSKVYKPLQDALRGVITGGTAEVVLTTKAVQVAGKTGTGEDGEKGSNNHSWFIAYAPYDDPDPDHRIVVAVQVERTNNWEWWAPKAANLIFQGIYAHQTYEEALKTVGVP